MKAFFTFLLCLTSMVCWAQTDGDPISPKDEEALTQLILELKQVDAYSQNYNDHESLAKALEHIDKAQAIYDSLSISNPEAKLSIESMLAYSYCQYLSHYTYYADRDKLTEEQYAQLVDKAVKIYLDVIDKVMANKDLIEQNWISYWDEAMEIATNEMSMRIVNKEDQATAESLTKMINAFELVLPQLNTSEKLYALDTYIHILLLNGDTEKAFQLISKGCQIDCDHKDFVALAARDDYKNWLLNRKANSQALLAKRVEELRTKFIGQNAANTKSTLFRKGAQEQALKTVKSDAKWTILPSKEYVKKYGNAILDKIIAGPKQKIAIFVYDGDLVCENSESFNNILEEINNPQKLNINKVLQEYAIAIVIKGNLIATSNLADHYYFYSAHSIFVQGDLYANLLAIDNTRLCVDGKIYVDELFKAEPGRHIVCSGVECGLDISSRYSYYPEIESQRPTITEHFGSLYDNSLKDEQREQDLRKAVYELLQAGLISPYAASILDIKHSDSYAKYLYPEHNSYPMY